MRKKGDIMTQEERDAQRALGNLEEFRVQVMVPVKVNVQMTQIVEAVSEEDAIEKMKVIHDIIPCSELLRNAVAKISNSFGNRARFDESAKREYTATIINRLKSSAGGVLSESGVDCESAS